jgi:hypothetical protein
MEIDTKSLKLPSPSRDGRPKKGAKVCVACKILVAPNSRPLDCQIAECPRVFIPAPTDREKWDHFVANAAQR